MSAQAPTDDTEKASSPQILPPGGHEIPIALLHTHDGKPVIIGNFVDNLDTGPPMLLRLGTRVSDRYPSCLGFRLMLRSHGTPAQPLEAMEDSYYVVSVRFRPHGQNSVRHTRASNDDFRKVVGIDPPHLAALYRVDFLNAGNGFEVTHHGTKPNNSESVVGALQQLEVIIRCELLSLFLPYDKYIVSWLVKAIENNGIGIKGPVWSDALPASAEKIWPANNQIQMAEGSADPLNVLRKALREPILDDAPVTALNGRPRARQFRAFAEAMLPCLQKSASKLDPILLDVQGGRCFEIPFGGSMYNRLNTNAAMHVLHLMLHSGIQMTDIGIVTFYPSQAAVYQDLLKALQARYPSHGYSGVKAATVDDWVGKEIGIAIVDCVRTANGGGNLGLLSQTRRLKVALSIHRDGLILIGDRECTTSAGAEGKITSTKLEKLFQWFEDNGRMAKMDSLGKPVDLDSRRMWTVLDKNHNATGRFFAGNDPQEAQLKADIKVQTSPNGMPKLATPTERILQSTTPDSPSEHRPSAPTPSAAIDEFKYRRLPPNEKAAASSSFARQGLLNSGLIQNSTIPEPESPTQVSGDTSQAPSNSISHGSPYTQERNAPVQRAQQNPFSIARQKVAEAQENLDPLQKPTKLGQVETAKGLGKSVSNQAFPAPVSAENVQASPRDPPLRQFPPRQNDHSPSLAHDTHRSSIQGLPSQQTKDFRSSYLTRYDSIRSLFSTFNVPSSPGKGFKPKPGANSEENRLFRQLGDAFISEDAKGFNVAYSGLLSLANRLHLDASEGDED
ncbi:uncharacterized protein KY384_009028 [Bacidia gigantensis]|uniref:uncharacterized protein n=1 Tax=Bacidia gigantensis TaxID=2732470 RepID=UPI001D041EB0|nr:uncharacterized protein KY384_009028 [Bacidia gigantensis]KAG8525384.1 hypothetical protein KY384_009028 [Bacidia gigantensis]